MTYETIEVEPITPVIGTEISGVDISKPLGNQTYQEIHDALMKHQVIFFRDQDMSLDEHKNFWTAVRRTAYPPHCESAGWTSGNHHYPCGREVQGCCWYEVALGCVLRP